MGNMVYLRYEGLVLTNSAGQDIWNIRASSSRRLRLHGWGISSNRTVAEIMAMELHFSSTIGSGGTSGALKVADALFGATPIATSNLGQTTPGTAVGGLQAYQWEQLGGEGHVYTPEGRPSSAIGQGFALSCDTAITPTLSGWVLFEEV